MIPLDEARTRKVCRICERPDSAQTPAGPLILEYGKEYAHEKCLVTAGVRPSRPAPAPDPRAGPDDRRALPAPEPAQGARFNIGKTRWDLIPGPGALSEVANVATYGMHKYDAHNWRKGLSWMDCVRAIFAHTAKWVTGEERDPESGCHHMAHAAWNALVLVEFALAGERYRKFDDRPPDVAPVQGTEHIKEPPKKLHVQA